MTATLKYTSLPPRVFSMNELKEAKEHLNSEGFVVFSPIMSSSELEHSKNLFWDALQTLNPKIDRFDKTTWTNHTFPEKFSSGIVSYYGLPQSDYAWNIRTNKNIKEIFMHLRGIEDIQDLCCSLDSLSIMFSSKNKSNLNLHRDQAYWLKFGDVQSLQGVFIHQEVGENDGGFVYCPKSHLEKENYGDYRIRNHFVRVFKENDLLDYYNNIVKLLLPKNTLIVFSSKLVHANVSASKDRLSSENGTPNINRIGLYVSYWSKELRSEETLKNKEKLYRRGEPTTHFGFLCQCSSPVYPYRRDQNADKLWFLVPKLLEDGGIPKERLALM